MAPPPSGSGEDLLFDTPGHDVTGRVLVVDDDSSIRMLYRYTLASQFDVLTASSGEEALTLCTAQPPDMVVLDLTMPGLDGHETCRRLRSFTDIPILFVTSSTGLDEKLKAFDSGGSDIICKPVDTDLLLRKVQVAIQQHQAAQALSREKQDLHKMAMGFLSSASQNGVLLGFVKDSITCQNHGALMERLMATARELGLESCALMHLGDTQIVAATRGVATALEASILQNAPTMGRQFQFKNRFVVNYEHISLMTANLPDEAEDSQRAGMLRDTLTALTEATEALVVNVSMRQTTQAQAQRLAQILHDTEGLLTQLKRQQRTTQADVRILLQDMVDQIEQTYSQLDTTHAQEAALNLTMNAAIRQIQRRLSNDGDFDALFAQLMAKLGSHTPTGS